MNRRFGMRRLALFLGAAGALLGCAYEVSEMKTIANYNGFQSLVNSDLVKNEAQSYIADVNKVRTAYFQRQQSLYKQIKPYRPNESYEEFRDQEALALQAGDNALKTDEAFRKIERLHSEINRAGIKQIQWTYDYAIDSKNPNIPWPRSLNVESIETQDDIRFYGAPAPTAWAYALLVLVPMIGFAIPWSAVMGLYWVLAGFSEPPPESSESTEDH